jgi:hypothetical protein
MLAAMSSSQLTEWIAFYAVEAADRAAEAARMTDRTGGH